MQDSGLALRKAKDLQLVQMSSALSRFGEWSQVDHSGEGRYFVNSYESLRLTFGH